MIPNFDASFGNLHAGDVQWKDSSLGALDIHKTNANVRDGSVNASVESASLSDARFQNEQLSSHAQTGSLQGIHFTGQKDNITGSVVSGNLNNIAASAAGSDINVDALSFQGANTQNNAEGLDLSLNQAAVSNINVSNEFASGGIQNADISDAHLKTTKDDLQFGSGKTSVGGIDYVVDMSKLPESDGSSSAMDTRKLIGTTAQLFTKKVALPFLAKPCI